MSRKQLTSKQHTFLQFLAEHVRKQKVWPTYREIVDEFGYRSPNSVTQNLQALAKKGYLTRDQNGYRLVGQRTGVQPGGFPIQGVIGDGVFEISLNIEEITLKDLYPDLDKTFAVRLDNQDVPDIADLDDGYLLLQEGTLGSGEVSAVLREGTVQLCRIHRREPLLCLQYLDGTEVQMAEGSFTLLGHYVGHISRYGLFHAPGMFRFNRLLSDERLGGERFNGRAVPTP